MSDSFNVFMASLCAGAVALLVGSMVTQNQIYIKCIERGHTVQMCKEITT